MLDRQRQPVILLPDQTRRYSVDEYHNPYLPKLTIKILPQFLQMQNYKFFSPLHHHQNITITQSLPLYRTQKLRIGLLWQQNIRTTYNQTHLGFVSQYNILKNYKIKSKHLLGSSYMTANSIEKNVQLLDKYDCLFSGVYSCFQDESKSLFHSVGVGASCKGLTLSATKRIDSNTVLRAAYEKLIVKDLYLRVSTQGDSQHADQVVTDIAIGYYWSHYISGWVKSNIQKYQSSPNLQVELQAKMKGDCVVASVQYKDQKSIVYLGYKCPSFNFIFPVFACDNPIPVIIAAGIYIYGYFNKKKEIKERQTKKEQDKVKQIRLIEDKANQNYKRQQARKGLLIEQVYIGQENLLQAFIQQANQGNFVLRNQKYKDNIFDATTSFRFYVQKGQLNLPSGSKLTILGCYYAPKENTRIYIKYQKDGQQFIRIFKQFDAIQI